jgi:hypothetical protein
MRRINHFAGLFVFNGLIGLSFRALVASRPLDRKSLSLARAERALRPAQGRLFEHDAFRAPWPNRKAAAASASASEVLRTLLTIVIVPRISEFVNSFWPSSEKSADEVTSARNIRGGFFPASLSKWRGTGRLCIERGETAARF